jgi:sarcosine oxidase
MQEHHDVIVVGTGVMGAATAWALAESGRKVLMLERFAIGHRRGSSHGTSRIFRFSYPEPEYVRMAEEARNLWRRLETDTGTDLLTITGGFDIGGDLPAHVAALDSIGARYEVMEGSDVSRRWDLLHVNGSVLYQPDAGIVAADSAWSTFVEEATSRGASLHESETVDRLVTHDEIVEVVTTRTTYTAAAVVVTAGAWARSLLADVDIPLETIPTRETIAYFDVPATSPTPSFVQWADPAIYGLATGQAGRIKLGVHHAGPVTDPDDEGVPSPELVRTLETWVGEHLPTADATARNPETCIYTNTVDERFVLERHGRVIVGSPCSGHGFKFAPLIGTMLCDLVTEVF